MRRDVLLVLAMSLVAVACGSGSAATTTSIVTLGSATTADSVTTTMPTLDSTTTSSSSTIAPPATTPPVICGDIDQWAGQDTARVTYIDDGRLWSVEIDGVHCLTDIPDRLTGVSYTWGPAGDKVLFADGSIIATATERDALIGVANTLGWTRPTGRSTIHVDSDGNLSKVTVEDEAVASTLTPLDRHLAVAYHPDGTTFAVSGAVGGDDGIWISKNDGSDAQLFATADVGVSVPEMVFTNDARWLVFIADHTQDEFDDGYHVHSVFTEPLAFEDGTMALGSAAEFGANTHLVSELPLDSIVVPSSGSGLADMPNGIAVARGECGPDRRAIYLPDGNSSSEPIPLSERPSYPVGFLTSGDAEQSILVAMSNDGCTGPFDWQVVSIDTAAHTTTAGMSGSAVDSLAVQSTLPTVDITLSGVVIEPFA